MSTSLNFTVTGRKLTLPVPGLAVIATQAEYETCAFAFDSAWEGYVKTAVFYSDKGARQYVVLDGTNTCAIPWEVVVSGTTAIYIGVFGINDAGAVLPTNFVYRRVIEGAGTFPNPPTEEVYNTVISELAYLRGKADALDASVLAAATSESNAAASESSAAGSAVSALESKNAAALSESNAATSETNAAGSAQAAAQSETNVYQAAETLDQLEVNYAPRLTTVESSLADKANQTAITENENILSVPISPYYKVYEKASYTSDPVYVGFVFDTNGLGVANGEAIAFSFDVVTDDTNVSSIYGKCFQNNTSELTDLFGGILETTPCGAIYIAHKKLNVFSCKFTINYDATYRYVKPYMCLNYVNVELFSTVYFKNVKCKIGNVQLTLLAQGMHGFVEGSTLTTYSERLTWDSAFSNKWKNKKANFLGDSITQGLYYNGASYSTADKKYFDYIKDYLGFSIVRNYGVSGTHVSGNYLIGDGSSGDPAQSLTNRYSAMDNDADLVVVLAGINDFVHAATAPWGTIDDITDISFYGALNVLMKGLILKYMGKKIIFLTPLHADGENTANGVTGKILKDYVNAIKDTAQKYGIEVIDTYSFSCMPTSIAEIKSTYINDGLHPNPNGHANLGELLARKLEVI